MSRKNQITKGETMGKSITGNEIGDEGVKSMSEMMKVNTTLTSLSLRRKGEEKEKRKEKEMMIE